MNNYLAIAIGNTRIKAVVFGRDRQIVEQYAYTHGQLSNLETKLSNKLALEFKSDPKYYIE